MNKLITPKRLKENEEFMWRLADRQLDTFIDRGSCEFLADYAKPFSLLVIADMLGVPIEDHEEFRAAFALETVGELGKEAPTSHKPLQWLNDKFYSYIENRRRAPRKDVLTELAQAKYEDGSTPEIGDVMNLSTFLFAAGTETTTKLVSRSDLPFEADRGLNPLLAEKRSSMLWSGIQRPFHSFREGGHCDKPAVFNSDGDTGGGARRGHDRCRAGNGGLHKCGQRHRVRTRNGAGRRTGRTHSGACLPRLLRGPLVLQRRLGYRRDRRSRSSPSSHRYRTSGAPGRSALSLAE